MTTPCLRVPLWSHPSEHPQSTLTARTHTHGGRKSTKQAGTLSWLAFSRRLDYLLQSLVLESHLNEWWIRCWRSLSSQKHPREEGRHERVQDTVSITLHFLATTAHVSSRHQTQNLHTRSTDVPKTPTQKRVYSSLHKFAFRTKRELFRWTAWHRNLHS